MKSAPAGPPRSLLDFTDTVVVVTGGSRGIGRGIATRFAEAGARVVVGYLEDARRAAETVGAVEAHGTRGLAIQADVTDPDAVEQLLDTTVEAFGGLDVLVNNAGVYPTAPLLDLTADAWDHVLGANLRSVHLCTRAAARRMVARGTAGVVVNVASIEAESPALLHSHYVAAKSGVVMYTRAAAQELGPQRIRVNAVSPGLVWKAGLDEAWPDGVRRYLEAVPLGRLGQPDDVADACLFLASPGARWITGANLVVDGGVLATSVY